MWKIVILIIIISAAAVAAVLIIVNVLGGRAAPQPESPAPVVVEEEPVSASPEEDPEAGTDESEPAGNDMGSTYSFGGSTVFDFVVIEDEFPRGTWSVNQVISEYGTPNEINSEYLPGYEIVFVRMDYGNFSFHFFPEYIGSFSFAPDVHEGGFYEMNEDDKNLEMELNAVQARDPGVKLPHGITIRQSTKAEIISAYGEEPVYEYEDKEYDMNVILYQYAFFDKYGELLEDYNEYSLGSIEYHFDDNDVLVLAVVIWTGFDL